MVNFNRLSKFMGLLLIILITAGCAASAANNAPETKAEPQEQVVLKVSGSGSTTGVLDAVKAKFEADVPGYKLEVLPGSGTGGGVKGIVQEVLDVAAMARPPKEEETAQDVAFVEIGQAGVGVITHPDVGVSELTSAQVVAIFSGEIMNWAEVGGPDLPLILYVRDEGDSSTEVLRKVFINETPFPETVAQVLTSQGDMLTAVAGTPGSIGIATWPTAVAAGAKVQAVTIEGVAPGDATYPMLSTLGIGYLGTRQADVQPLIDWLGSDKGQTALQEFDVIVTQ